MKSRGPLTELCGTPVNVLEQLDTRYKDDVIQFNKNCVSGISKKVMFLRTDYTYKFALSPQASNCKDIQLFFVHNLIFSSNITGKFCKQESAIVSIYPGLNYTSTGLAH